MKLNMIESLPEILRENSITINLKKGQRLFRKGDRASYLYLIQHGRFQEISYPEGDKIAVLQILTTEETLGETSLRSEFYRSTVIASTNARVIGYPKSILLETVDRSPLLIEALIEILVQKIDELQTRLEWRNIAIADRRVLQYLKHKLDKLAQDGDDSQTLVLDTPLQEIAAELGFVPGTLSRALAKLEAERAITRDKNRITIHQTNVA